MYKKVNGVNVALTQKEIDDRKAEEIVVAKEIEDNAWLESRLSEYPSIEEQLDSIYHKGIDAWKAEIKVIKDKYPKG